MRTGRKPKPTALKEAEGNRGHRPPNPNEPKAPVGAPKAPPHVRANPVAFAEWKWAVPLLMKMKILTEADKEILALYCMETALNRRAWMELADNPLVFKTKQDNPINNNLIGIVNTSGKLLARYATELGLTPSSRSRLNSNETQPEELKEELELPG